VEYAAAVADKGVYSAVADVDRDIYTSVADVDRGIYASVAAAAAVLTMKKNLIIF
jgi:hypothetical protein